MKLEPRFLTPYLQHSLKVIMEGKRTNVAWMSTKNIAVIRPDGVGEYKRINWKHAHHNIKPILRPLSDLTKEITINGKTFIPIYKLFELEYKGTVHLENIRKMYFEEVGRFISCSHLGTAMSTSINVLNPDKNNYWKIQKLHEWHFDTNALINEDLAIDVNTLKD